MGAGPLRSMFRAATLAFSLLAAAGIAGCRDMGDITGSIGPGPGAMPSDPQQLRDYTEQLGHRFDSDPGQKSISIAYSKGLRALQRFHEASSVMQVAAVKASQDFDVLGEYGRALADDGQLQQAKDVLTRAYAPERPDWRILSAQGTVADRLDDHIGAQEFYHRALQIEPNDPATLSDLGLSLALTKSLPEAEQVMRQAIALPGAGVQIRNNLALVLALEGKFAESQKVVEQDLSPADAAANVSAIKQMIAQTPTWRDLQAGKGKGKTKQPPLDAVPVDANPDAPT
jgi:Flp pilus assembly protein TadD